MRRARPGVRGAYGASFAFGVLSFAVVAGLGVGSGIVVSRIYGVDTIGRYALVAAPVAVLWYVSTVREQVGLVRALAVLPVRDPGAAGRFAAVLGFSFALSALVGAVTFGVVALLFSGPIDHPDLVAPAGANIAGYVLFTNTSWNLDSVFAAYRAGRRLFWARVGTAVAYFVAAVGFGVASRSLWALTIATVAATAAGLLLRVPLVHPYLTVRVGRAQLREGVQSLSEVLRFGLKLTPGAIAEGLTGQAGTWLLGAAAPLASLGAYYRSLLLSNRLTEVGYRVNEVLFPTLVERRSARDDTGFDRAAVDSARYLLFGLALAASVGAGCARGVMTLYGPGFGQASTALALLLPVPALAALIGVQNHVLNADDRPLTGSIVAVGRLVLVVALTVGLGIPYGSTGAATALLLGYATSVVWLHALVRSHLREPLRTLWPVREAACLALAYGCGFAAARGLDRALAWPAGLCAGLVAGTAAFGVVFVVGGGFNDRDRTRLATVRARRRGDAERTDLLAAAPPAERSLPADRTPAQP